MHLPLHTDIELNVTVGINVIVLLSVKFTSTLTGIRLVCYAISAEFEYDYIPLLPDSRMFLILIISAKVDTIIDCSSIEQFYHSIRISRIFAV